MALTHLAPDFTSQCWPHREQDSGSGSMWQHRASQSYIARMVGEGKSSRWVWYSCFGLPLCYFISYLPLEPSTPASFDSPIHPPLSSVIMDSLFVHLYGRSLIGQVWILGQILLQRKLYPCTHLPDSRNSFKQSLGVDPFTGMPSSWAVRWLPLSGRKGTMQWQTPNGTWGLLLHSSSPGRWVASRTPNTVFVPCCSKAPLVAINKAVSKSSPNCLVRHCSSPTPHLCSLTHHCVCKPSHLRNDQQYVYNSLQIALLN